MKLNVDEWRIRLLGKKLVTHQRHYDGRTTFLVSNLPDRFQIGMEDEPGSPIRAEGHMSNCLNISVDDNWIVQHVAIE